VSLFVAMLGLGLVTSLHCVAMCGGLVLAYAVKGTREGTPWRRLTPHLVYQATKIASYATVALVLGAIVALAGRAVDVTGFRNWLMVVAGVYMVVLGLSMTGKFEALRYLSPRPPKALAAALSSLRRRANADATAGRPTLVTPLVLGALTGLMPCAPLIAAQSAAVSTGSPLSAASAMVGFGLGTAPLMLVFGLFSSLLSRSLQRRLQIVAALAVIVFGVVIFGRALALVGSPVTFDSMREAVAGASATATSSPASFRTGSDGVAEIPLAIRDTAYVPHDIVIPADRPVRLVVDRQEDLACSDQLAIPAARLLVDLRPNGVTKVTVPPLGAGEYTMTCGMGMMSGRVVVVGAGAGPQTARNGSLLALTLLAVVTAGLVVHAWRATVLARMGSAAGAPPAVTPSAPRTPPSPPGGSATS
jgi:sulfite exporter TauE/SafE